MDDLHFIEERFCMMFCDSPVSYTQDRPRYLRADVPFNPVGCAFYLGILFHRPWGLDFWVLILEILFCSKRNTSQSPTNKYTKAGRDFHVFLRFFREQQQDVKIQGVEIWMYSNDCFGWCILQDLVIFFGAPAT